MVFSKILGVGLSLRLAIHLFADTVLFFSGPNTHHRLEVIIKPIIIYFSGPNQDLCTVKGFNTNAK